MIKNSQRRKEKREAAKWLLSLVGEDWGIRVLPHDADSPRPVHANTNKRFEAVISKTSGVWLQRLSQRLIIRHFEGVPRPFRISRFETITKPETVYFTGRRTKPGETCLTLLMIDIDAHKIGGPKEAMAFARYLGDNFFPACYTSRGEEWPVIE